MIAARRSSSISKVPRDRQAAAGRFGVREDARGPRTALAGRPREVEVSRHSRADRGRTPESVVQVPERLRPVVITLPMLSGRITVRDRSLMQVAHAGDPG